MNTPEEQAAIDSMLDAMDKTAEEPTGAADSDSEATPTFEFDEDFQMRVAALSMRDSLFLKRCAHLIEPDYFDNFNDKLVAKLVLEHYEKFGSTLEDPAVMKQVLGDALRRRKIRDEEKSGVIARVKELYRVPTTNPEFTADAVAEFAKNQAVEKAFAECIDLHEKRDFDKMREVMEKAFKVGQRVTGQVYDYFGENKNREDYRDKIAKGVIKRKGLPIGVPQFDNLLHHKGFGYSELTVFMAGAKRGKTTAMWDIARRWAIAGHNVLGITLEVSTGILSDRVDANLSGTKMKDLEKDYEEVAKKVEAAGKRAGKFLIHEYPSNSLRPLDVEAIIEDYRAQGIFFDAVVVDYLDIMAPNKWMPNDIANSKSIWSDMRGIAQKFDLVMLSATQLNREGAKKATADDTDVAEDYNKIRIADLVMTINATDEELARGEARIFFAASRNQRGKFSVLIKNDMERMQFMKTILEVS